MSNSHFLRSLAERCKAEFGENCGQLKVIFPNKRAGVYFASYLSELYEKPIWSPMISSFESFVEEQQDKKLADELQLSFILYKAYKQLVPHAESFDAFLPWGEMILKDFNDIDNYLVETKHIFHVIKSQKELDEAFHFLSEEDQKTVQQFWQGFLPEPDKKQSEFIKTWSILDQLYVRFNELLAEQNLTYKGHLFREFCENNQLKDTGAVWFAGFNALTRAEEKIIKECLETGSSDIFWELDRYYFEDEYQEAGLFFREYAKDSILGASVQRDIQDVLNTKDKQIDLISAPLKMGQVMACTQKLEELAASAEGLKDTLVILSEESLLPVLLDKLPEAASQVNITMGWSIAQARAYILFEKMLVLAMNRSKDSQLYLTFKELSDILSFNDFFGLEQEKVDAWQKACLENQRYFFPPEELIELLPRIEAFLNAQTSAQILAAITDFIHESPLDEWAELDRSVAVLLHSTFKRLAKAAEQFQIELEPSSLLRLYKKLGTNLKLPFTGDSDGGLQVMGILETRNLSFKNILILGMNEGSWPRESSQSSFIPYNIRKAFDLPTTEHQDAMQAYLFYRLLHNSDQLWISYNNVTEFNKNGELSRYMQQLEFESDETKVEIKRQSVLTQIAPVPAYSITKTKTAEVMKRLGEYLYDSSSPRKLSPSALNTYIDCKLKFYFNYVERIYEPNEIREDIDPSMLGNLLHRAMEFLYEGQSEMTKELAESLNGKVEAAVKAAFVDQKLNIEDSRQSLGRQMIVFEVIKKFVLDILRTDAASAPFEFVGLESEDFFYDFPIETMEGSTKVSLKGIIDRIDRKGESIRIVDYKSGSDNREFGDLEDLLDAGSTNRNKAVFQLFYYSMLYKENHPDNALPIQPLMYNSRDLSQADFDGQIRQKKGTKGSDRKGGIVMDYRQFEEEYKQTLEHLLTEIFNSSIDFNQTDDLKKCQYCPYVEICRRS
ncbi:PD-(D/E)XK nuclease family protein [Reichenbachiella ulvae]|uniref:Exodeoxyribonuclease V subunit gamma n=1 Tax=Reichenbachiella ulvae TaxID=2980104 RepID=A0ABT3CNM9_9BACT|nr:PD-(D/E)XK nuclease family protein [Reichenbachiella ulvae]MCV9385315.1 exodeoxyribonuclease V subunit gamma [Reichenbachiella ulvae]